MIKKILVGLSVILVLGACSSDSNRILLDHDLWYKVPPGFISKHVSQVDVNDYASLFLPSMGDRNPFVLYKLMKGPALTIYIGVCFEVGRIHAQKEIFNIADVQIISQDSLRRNSFTIFYKKRTSVFVLHHFKEFETGNKYLFTAISADSAKLASGFVDNFFENRIDTN